MKGAVITVLLVSIAVCFIGTSCVIFRHYNNVDYDEMSTFEEFTNKYMNLEKDQLNQNMLLGVASPECWHKLSSPAFLGMQRYSGGGQLSVVTLPSKEFPHALQDCAEIHFYRKGNELAHPEVSTNSFDHKDLNRWVSDRASIKGIRLKNDFDFPVKYYWHEESATPVLQGELEAGQTIIINSILGHIFSANSLSPLFPEHNQLETSESQHDGFYNIVDFMVVDGDDYSFSPYNRMETCEVMSDEENTASFGQFAEQWVECNNMYLRMYEFTHSIWHTKRLALNYVQPQLVRAVTETGFEKRQLPPDTYRWLQAWYEEQKKLREEAESSSGPCMNQHVAPSTITHLTPVLKDRLSLELQPILEDWYGGDLKLTSIYGVRWGRAF